MGFVEGLKQMTEALAPREQNFEDRPKARWVKLKSGDSVRIVFLQELDVDSPNYSKKNGLGRLVSQHTSPKDWRKKAECTIETGSCYGCEQQFPLSRQFYINVLVDDGKEDPYVAVLSRGTGKNSVSRQILEYAAEDETITDKWFKLKREGDGKDDTTYFLMPSKPHDLDIESFEVYDLGQVVFRVKPENQESYYGGVSEDSEQKTESKPNRVANVDSDW